MKWLLILGVTTSLFGCTKISNLTNSTLQVSQGEIQEVTLTGLLTKEGESYNMSGPAEALTVVSETIDLEPYVDQTITVEGTLRGKVLNAQKVEPLTD